MHEETCDPREQSDDSVPTWSLLQEIGFGPDNGVVSDVRPGLSFDFGNLKLSASCVLSRCFREVVLLTGKLLTDRTGCLICDEMPRVLESRELGLAWLAYCLDKAAGGRFEPANETEWVAQGRLHRHLLPWEQESAEYAARPCCYVQRPWARVALKTLAEHLATTERNSAVVLEFDGEVLKIRCAEEIIAMPASGKQWPHRFSIAARSLGHLPKRLMRDPVEFSVSKTTLTISRRHFALVATPNAPTTTPELSKRASE